MITDASNVEDIKHCHIKEFLLLSCVSSFEDWSNIFRTRSFTLCKNDLDFNDTSDSVTVLKSKSSSSTINLSVCCANKPGGCSFARLPVLRCCCPRAQRKLTFMSGFPVAGVLSLHRETKFIIGADFVLTLSSLESSCVLFDSTSELFVELKWLMLNKHKR